MPGNCGRGVRLEERSDRELIGWIVVFPVAVAAAVALAGTAAVFCLLLGITLLKLGLD